MKRLRISPLLIAFSTCLVIGLIGGAFIARSGELPVTSRSGVKTSTPAQHAGMPAAAPPSPVPRFTFSLPVSTPTRLDPSATPAALSTPPSGRPSGAGDPAKTGQKNLLVIGIDDLHSHQPQLESIWLVIYLTTSPHLKLLPIYPALLEGGLQQDGLLESVFQLDPGLQPDPSFLAGLYARDLWWENYIVLDKTGLAKLIEMVSGADLEDGPDAGLRVIASLPLARDDPQAALLGQTALLRAMCRLADGSPTTLDLAMAFDILSEHISTDLAPHKAIPFVQKILESGAGLTCEFPTSKPSQSVDNQ